MKTYRILVIGDLHFGESYKSGGVRNSEKYGYDHSLVHLQRFADACDTSILNLETPLVDPDEFDSPLEGKKDYIHWGDPQRNIEALKRLGVESIGLANNHSGDYGAVGLKETFRHLSKAGIHWFGAGNNSQEAESPYRLALPETVGGGEIHFHASFQNTTRYDKNFDFYASEEAPGCARLVKSKVLNARTNTTRADSFHVAFPHWGPNYQWRSSNQYEIAHRYLKKDYDLVLGHGGHSIQEVHRKLQRWIVYGIGNGLFNSGGRWKRQEKENGILPFGFWSVIEVQQHHDERRVKLKLYPVYSNNRDTGYQPGPVSLDDFHRTLSVLAEKPARPWRFENSAQTSGLDDLGHFIELDLGSWEKGARPSRLLGPTETGDPADWPLRSPSLELEDEVIGLRKHLGAAVLSLAAARDGGTTQWFSDRVGLVSCGDIKVLIRGYDGHESLLAKTLVRDKVLTAAHLSAAGVPTPRTVEVDSAEAATKAAESFFGPVVVKPVDGNKSRGVSTDLKTSDQVREAYSYAKENGSRIIVQEYIRASEELRVMASGERAVAVNGRALPHVVGDGFSTVRQLVKDKNLQRRLNPSLVARPIPMDALTRRQLEELGLTLDSVPDCGERVIVRNVAALSVGGDTIQALDETSTNIKETAAAAVRAIPGLGWGGIDFVVEQGSGQPYVIEVNNQAAYGSALFPAYGEPKDVGSEVWDLRYRSAVPEKTSVPELPMAHDEPKSVLNADLRSSKDKQWSIWKVLYDCLRDEGYAYEELNKNIRQVSKPDGSKVLLTRSCLGYRDRAIVQMVLKNHRWVCELLDMGSVPRVRSKTGVSKVGLSRFLQKPAWRFMIKQSLDFQWSDPEADLYAPDQALALDLDPKSSFVQVHMKGVRVRVLASDERVYLISSRAQANSLTGDDLAQVGALAIQAIRAVPELRWAAVDILVRQARLEGGRPGGVLVEGMTAAPRYSRDDLALAGEFSDFAQFLVDSSTDFG